MSKFAFRVERAAQARGLVRSTLGGVPDEVVDTTVLLTSELVTNAIVHGESEPTLVLEVGEGCIRVEVQDADPETDLAPLQVEPFSEHGRGLAIVDALSSSWGVEPRGDGKAVWFSLDL